MRHGSRKWDSDEGQDEDGENRICLGLREVSEQLQR